MGSGRGAYSNIIPGSTGAAIAIGSVIDVTCVLKKDTNYDEVCAAMKKAAEGELKGILGYTDEKIVSSDVLGDSRSSIFDSGAGMMMGKRLVSDISWYDNEWGYSCRLWELCAFTAKKERI